MIAETSTQTSRAGIPSPYHFVHRIIKLRSSDAEFRVKCSLHCQQDSPQNSHFDGLSSDQILFEQTWNRTSAIWEMQRCRVYSKSSDGLLITIEFIPCFLHAILPLYERHGDQGME